MEQLPKDALENILRRLSVYDIIRAGCACKTFKALVSSGTLTSSYTPVGLLLLPHEDSQRRFAPARIYDSGGDTWIALSLAFLQLHLPEFAYPVASDGGLICFGSGCDFVVCNPITKSWRRVPHLAPTAQQLDEASFQAFGLCFNPASGTYNLFLLNHCVSNPHGASRLMTFSSASSQWTDMLPLTIPGEHKLHCNAIISCNSRLYTLWRKGDFLTIFAFGNGIWSEIEAPDCTSRLLKAFLMDFSGSLYMVGAVGVLWLQSNSWLRPTAVRIWKLLTQSSAWTEVTRMPSSILQEYQENIDFDELQWCGKNGVMYMRSSQSDVLMFDLLTRQWKWLDGSEMDSLVLIYEPSLSALA